MADLAMNSATGKRLLALIREADHAHPGEEEANRLLFAGLAPDPGRRILDAGCGGAGTAAWVQAQGSGGVTGLEVDAETVRLARERYPGVTVVQGDLQRAAGPARGRRLAPHRACRPDTAVPRLVRRPVPADRRETRGDHPRVRRRLVRLRRGRVRGHPRPRAGRLARRGARASRAREPRLSPAGIRRGAAGSRAPGSPQSTATPRGASTSQGGSSSFCTK